MILRIQIKSTLAALMLCMLSQSGQTASLALKVISCPHDFSFVSGLAPQDTCSSGFFLGMSGARTWKATTHFGPIGINAGSIVDSALLAQCNSASNADSLDPTVIVYGVNRKNQSCIKDTVNWNTGFGSRTAAADTMTSPDWAGKSATFTYYRTFRVTSIIQELLNRTDWQSGDSLAFVFVSDSANSRLKQRSFAPIDNASRGDSLLIWYHAATGGPNGTLVLLRQY